LESLADRSAAHRSPSLEPDELAYLEAATDQVVPSRIQAESQKRKLRRGDLAAVVSARRMAASIARTAEERQQDELEYRRRRADQLREARRAPEYPADMRRVMARRHAAAELSVAAQVVAIRVRRMWAAPHRLAVRVLACVGRGRLASRRRTRSLRRPAARASDGRDGSPRVDDAISALRRAGAAAGFSHAFIPLARVLERLSGPEESR
jgi:hypothetical protein